MEFFNGIGRLMPLVTSVASDSPAVCEQGSGAAAHDPLLQPVIVRSGAGN